jgi:leucyl aminopeptidase
MASVSVVSPDAPIRADAVVVGLRRVDGSFEVAAGAEPVDAALGGRLRGALTALGATGRQDEVLKVPTLGLADFGMVVATGLGTDGSAEAARRAAGAAVRALSGSRRVHIAIDGDPQALAEGALLGAYAFTEYKSRPARHALRTITVGSGAAGRAAVRRARVVAAAVSTARDLVAAERPVSEDVRRACGATRRRARPRC